MGSNLAVTVISWVFILASKQEQKRIELDLAETEAEIGAERASLAQQREVIELALAEQLDETYVSASPSVRRQLNEAVFETITVPDKHVTEYELREPFRSLTGATVPDAAIGWR